ncbi:MULTISPECIES: hypothetical protein [Protofrankia]|nr:MULTISPECIES: hypothetical protein [Protofrankia]
MDVRHIVLTAGFWMRLGRPGEAVVVFADEYAEVLSVSGIPVVAAAIPDEESVQRSLDSATDWFFSLATAVREGFDETSGENRACFYPRIAGDQRGVEYIQLT